MIKRNLYKKIEDLTHYYSVIYIGGPRQSGKTTLVKEYFKDLPYTNLENPDTRELALTDPRRFIDNYPKGAIFDEIQNTPLLFSYLKK